MHIIHIILHIGPYLLAYYFAYFTYFHSYYCIFCILFCILFCIFYMLLENHKVLFQVIHCSRHYCSVPHPRAQLLTYHHLQPSRLSFVLSQTAPGKSLTLLACRTVSSLSGGSRPSMLDTGMTIQ
jgi:hypothetical protein